MSWIRVPVLKEALALLVALGFLDIDEAERMSRRIDVQLGSRPVPDDFREIVEDLRAAGVRIPELPGR